MELRLIPISDPKGIRVQILTFDTGKTESISLIPCPPDLPTAVAPPGMAARTVAECFPTSRGTCYCPEKCVDGATSLLFHVYRVEGAFDLQTLISCLKSLDWLDPGFTTLISTCDDLAVFQHRIPEKLRISEHS